MAVISLITNATANDGLRLHHFIPAALEQFGPWLKELIVVVDEHPEQGRIRQLHGNESSQISLEEIKRATNDNRVRFQPLDYGQLSAISHKWFGVPDVNRCQAGTPIFAFVYAIEQATSPWAIKTDCDVLFFNRGMIDFFQQQKNACDLIQLPMLNMDALPFSSRAFAVNLESIRSKLPLQPLRLDPLRRLIRNLNGRSSYMAFEQILQHNIDIGRLTHYRMNNDTGYTMHIGMRKDFQDIESVVARFKNGLIPTGQFNEVHDFVRKYWEV